MRMINPIPSRQEYALVRKALEQFGVSVDYRYNDKCSTFRRIVYKSFSASEEDCLRVIDFLKSQGVVGYELYKGIHGYGNFKLTGIKKYAVL